MAGRVAPVRTYTKDHADGEDDTIGEHLDEDVYPERCILPRQSVLQSSPHTATYATHNRFVGDGLSLRDAAFAIMVIMSKRPGRREEKQRQRGRRHQGRASTRHGVRDSTADGPWHLIWP